MWPDWEDRVTELTDKAKFFEMEGYHDTAKWIRYLSEQLKVRRPVANLERDLDDMLEAFRSEYRQGNPHRRKLLETLETIFFAAVRSGRFGKELLLLLPILEDIAVSSRNIMPIGEAFRPIPPGKVRFYGMCLLYLLNAEGMFDQAVRTVYGLASIAAGKSFSGTKVNEMSIHTIREEFAEIGIPDILFDGWVNGHVRNSIAHCRFYYDDTMQKMRFRDFDPRTKKPTYDECYTIEEFSELYFKLDDVWHIVEHLIFMIRAIQLVLAPEVPKADKFLTM